MNGRDGFSRRFVDTLVRGWTSQMRRTTLLAIIYVSLLATADASLDYYGSHNHQQLCYSCMSMDKEQTWAYLQHVYYKPKNFTDHCNRPMATHGMGLVPCTSVCVVITEMRIVSGHFAGYSHTRGCLSSIARLGFRNTTMRDYQFELVPKCERLPRNAVFYKSNPTIEDQIYFCTCFGDRCNDDRISAGVSYRSSLVTYSQHVYRFGFVGWTNYASSLLLLALRSLVFPTGVLFLWSCLLVHDIRLRCS